MDKRVGIYKVLDKHKDLTKRMNEDARYNLTNKLSEADDELDLDDTNLDDTDPNAVNPDAGVEGGLDLGNGADQPAEDDDALDLDALADDGSDEAAPVDDMGGEPAPTPMSLPPQGDFAPPAETPAPAMDQSMSTEPTEEIDVTDFVEKGEQLTQKVDTQVQAMATQIQNLTQKLSSMDQLIGQIQKVEDEIHAMKPQKPIETLRLRSLDSYPYNQGIDDYWKKKEIEIDKLRDFNRVDDQQEFVLTNDDINNFSDIQIRDSLKPNNPAANASQFSGPKTNQQQPSRFNRQKE